MTKLFLGLLSLLIIAGVYFNHLAPNAQTKPLNQAVPAKTEPCPPRYYLIGYDRVTGDPVCKTSTNCPNGDSIPVDSPNCGLAPKEPEWQEVKGK